MEKSKLQKSLEKFRESPKGVLTNMYDHMRRRHKIDFTLKEFQERFLEDKKFLRLHKEPFSVILFHFLN